MKVFSPLKSIILIFFFVFSSTTFAANPSQPFLPSDNIQDPGCLPTDSNCYVKVDVVQNGGNSYGTTLSIGTNDNNALEFKTASTTRLTIEANGNVGVGTDTPTASLHIQRDIDGGDDFLKVSTSTTFFRLTSAGNIYLGQGTATDINDAVDLIYANSAVSSGGAQYISTRNWSTGGTGFRALTSQYRQFAFAVHNPGSSVVTAAGRSLANWGVVSTSNSLNGIIFTTGNSNASIVFNTNAGSVNADTFRIDNNQNIGISSSTPSARLSVKGGGTGTGLLTQFTDSANVARFTVLDNGSVGIGTTTPADRLQVFGDVRLGTTGTNGCIKDFGGTGITGTCSSDERLKTNIVDLSDGYLDKMNNLKLITYNWNNEANTLNKVDTTVTNYGLLAQNVEAIFPELVSVDSNGYKQVNYSRIPLYLLKAVQELSKKVAGFTDGTLDIFGKDVRAKDKLCVGNTCVTEEQLIRMMNNENVQPTQNMITPDPVVIEPVSTSTEDVVVPPVDDEEEEEPIPEPALIEEVVVTSDEENNPL